MNLSFFVPGLPVPQGSKRAFVIRGKDGRHRPVLTESAKGLTPWRSQVAFFAQDAMRSAGCQGWFAREPLVAVLTFRFPRPASLPRRITRHVRRPDADKIARSVFDALQGVCYGDDSQIVRLEVEKVYDGRAGVQVEVRSVEP